MHDGDLEAFLDQVTEMLLDTQVVATNRHSDADVRPFSDVEDGPIVFVADVDLSDMLRTGLRLDLISIVRVTPTVVLVALPVLGVPLRL